MLKNIEEALLANVKRLDELAAECLRREKELDFRLRTVNTQIEVADRYSAHLDAVETKLLEVDAALLDHEKHLTERLLMTKELYENMGGADSSMEELASKLAESPKAMETIQ